MVVRRRTDWDSVTLVAGAGLLAWFLWNRKPATPPPEQPVMRKRSPSPLPAWLEVLASAQPINMNGGYGTDANLGAFLDAART